MPDIARLLRGTAASELAGRIVAHLVVLSLVASASFSPLAEGASAGDRPADAVSRTGPFVSSVRAGTQHATPERLLPDADPVEVVSPHELNRGARSEVAPTATPLPTPVPVDPNATPLPAPSSIAGSAPSVRSAPTASSALVWPVPAGSVSQYFHAGHLALDIAASYGADVLAAHDGVVTWAGWRNDGGGYVVIVVNGAFETRYNHLGSVWVYPGQHVAAGQSIGGVGCSGVCTGPHLHFVLFINGAVDNPLRHL